MKRNQALIREDGAWHLSPTGTPTPVVPSNLNFNGKPMFVYPNPARWQVTFAVNLEQKGAVDLYLYNFAGEKIAHLAQAFSAAGVQTLTWDCRHIAAGVYIARLLVDHKEKQKAKLAVVH